MHFPFSYKSHEPKSRNVPDNVKAFMVARFRLLPEYIGLLRCFEYADATSNGPVKRLIIFDPLKARERKIIIKTRADLLAHRELIQYEGHIDSHGQIYVADRRKPIFFEKRQLTNAALPGNTGNAVQQHMPSIEDIQNN